jgi:hypothetical protein
MAEQQEYPCASCTNGMISIPKMEMDAKGNPYIIQDLITCIVCGGNGKVLR